METIPERVKRNAKLLLTILPLVLLILAVYSPVRRAGFIWDDDDHVTANPAMTASNGLRQIWSSQAVSRYYPLTLTTFWIEHHRWNLDPIHYHDANVLLHALNVVLLLFLLRELKIPGAWFIAAAWGLHPVCVESVAWVTELKNVQSAFFFFFALLAYRHHEARPNPARYLLLLLFSAAAMLSKSSTVILPAIILLMILWERGTWTITDWKRVAPLFLGALLMAVWTVLEQRYQISRTSDGVPVRNFFERLLLAADAIWFYLLKILWPADLVFLYPQWKVAPASLWHWVPLLLLVIVAGLLWHHRQSSVARAITFGFGGFIIALLPVLGFFDLYFFRYTYVADHFQYLACIGPIALAAVFASKILKWPAWRGIVAGLALLFLCGLSWQYTHSFLSLEILWQDVIVKNPSAWLAHNNLGAILAGHKELNEAAGEYAMAIQLKPDFAEAYNNLGNLYARQKELTKAAEEYQTAIHYDPRFAGAHYNLGNVLIMQGQTADALEQYEAALKINPQFSEAQHNLNLARKKLSGN